MNGTEVPVVGFEEDKGPVAMVHVLDSSRSAQVRFNTTQEDASKLVAALPSNFNVMVVDFNYKLNRNSVLRLTPSLKSTPSAHPSA